MQARFLSGLGPVPPVLGLAVSGGGDSVALLSLAVEAGIACHAVTVDHGLRDGSAAEAATVAATCAAMGVPHDILRWHWDGAGNLQDAARRARRAMIADWALARGIGMVALGHTRDDVAETFLMRLSRGAGLDGLSAMRGAWSEGIEWRRPLLAIGRAELRDHLTARGIAWAEDPSNDNPRFERVRARQAMAALPLGLTADRLAAVAAHLAEARAALEQAMLDAARRHARIIGGDVVIETDGLSPEILRRLLLQALAWVAPADYQPRGEALARVLSATTTASLHGCLIQPTANGCRIGREPQAVASLQTSGPVWDCWHLDGPHQPGQHIAALGEGIAEIPNWREAGLPRASLMASPAVRLGPRLIARAAGRIREWLDAAAHSSPRSVPFFAVIALNPRANDYLVRDKPEG